MSTDGGGPIPGTQKIIQVSYTDTTDQVLFAPNKGEVWMLVGGDLNSQGGSTKINFELADGRSGTTPDGSGKKVYLWSTTVSGQEPLSVEGSPATQTPIYISYENYLWGNIISYGASSNARVSISVIQVR